MVQLFMQRTQKQNRVFCQHFHQDLICYQMIHISQILGNFNTIIAEHPKHVMLSTRKLHKSYSNKTKKQRKLPGLETLIG